MPRSRSPGAGRRPFLACSANIGSALTLIGQYLGLPFGGYLVFAALADRPFAALSPGHRPRALPGKISSSQGGEGGAGTALQRMADGEGRNRPRDGGTPFSLHLPSSGSRGSLPALRADHRPVKPGVQRARGHASPAPGPGHFGGRVYSCGVTHFRGEPAHRGEPCQYHCRRENARPS